MKEESIYNPTSYKLGTQEFAKGDIIYLGDAAYQIEGEDIINKGDINYPTKEISQTTKSGPMFYTTIDKQNVTDKPTTVLKLQPVSIKYNDKGDISTVAPIPKKSTRFVGDQTEQVYYLTPERLAENEAQGKFSFAKKVVPTAPVANNKSRPASPINKQPSDGQKKCYFYFYI